jgi:hypothetical protein
MATDVDSTSLIEFNMIPTFISDELVPGLQYGLFDRLNDCTRRDRSHRIRQCRLLVTRAPGRRPGAAYLASWRVLRRSSSAGVPVTCDDQRGREYVAVHAVRTLQCWYSTGRSASMQSDGLG